MYLFALESQEPLLAWRVLLIKFTLSLISSRVEHTAHLAILLIRRILCVYHVNPELSPHHFILFARYARRVPTHSKISAQPHVATVDLVVIQTRRSEEKQQCRFVLPALLGPIRWAERLGA